ncbi:hypothetical protein AAF712_005775 [Marasmius tenuissimus]|uniref:Ricin B lectin domain-containing protein n=1 Tax=Marasmius tenuissimus TaxID=585030 RepID=A0ABR3A116_9AGAR
MHLAAISLYAFVAVSSALRIESANPAFGAAGRRGCLTVLTPTLNAPVVIWDCNLTVEQNWTYAPAGAPNSVGQPIKLFGTKCLDVKDGANADGTKLQMYDCFNQAPNQQWVVNTDTTFQWAGTNKCIDLTNGSITNGNQLQISTCDRNNANQRYYSTPV